MAGISKLPEELRLEILGLLIADHDALFSLYNTSFTFRSYLVVYLLRRHPALLISWAAKNGDFKLLQKVVDEYPEATLDGPCPNLAVLCPKHALVIAARRGHAKVVEIILTLETTHKAQAALIGAAKGGHADVVSILLENFLGHRSSGFHDALSEALQRGHIKVVRELLKYGDPDCYSCTTVITLLKRTARKGKKGKSPNQHRVAK